jgi:hypothetical protein
MGPFLITDPSISSYWRDLGSRWLRGRHPAGSSIVGDGANVPCLGGPLCPRRHDPDHVSIIIMLLYVHIICVIDA